MRTKGSQHRVAEVEQSEALDTVPLDGEASEATSLPSPSQQSNHSDYSAYDGDIYDTILAWRQFDENPPPPTSNNLNKRKANEISPDASDSFQEFRPSKIPKPTTDIDNLFNSTSIPIITSVYPEKSNIIISPSRHLQKQFDNLQLPYGSQYEIARLVSVDLISYEAIDYTVIQELATMKSNKDAAPITETMLLRSKAKKDDSVSFAKETAAKSPWVELDKEEEALRTGQFKGLGVESEYEDWYGGKVHFRALLVDDSDKSRKITEPRRFKLSLERAVLGPSDRFGRRFGSKNFLRLKLSKSVMNTRDNSELFKYLTKPFVICGGVFRAFFAKDTNVFLVKTNEAFDGFSVSQQKHDSSPMFSFLEFIHWHNALELKPSQTMAKWASRFALGLSNSAPGLLVQKCRLVIGTDIVSEAGSQMTDGAGTINRVGLSSLRHKFSWDTTPSAVQVRIWGSKGLLVEDRDNKDEQPLVTLTPSQIKINYPDEVSYDPAHLIVDVLRSSHTRTPCRLSAETIVNLAENGVPHSAFLELLKQCLDELVHPLLEWNGPKAMQALWATLNFIGGVMPARRAREEVGLARVKGFSERDPDEPEIDDEDGFQLLKTEQRSSAWWADECSGCPSSLEETVMYLIASGFTPDNCSVMRSKLEMIVKSRVKEKIKSYRINVPMSATAFLVPDIHGVLEPGEIFFRSSRRQLRNFDGTETDLIIGDVLVTRHPCKLPTDVQKWKAVDKTELHYLTDVIVLSTQGNRRAADFLAGGDYDGDKGTIIWQPELVKPFKNASLDYSETPKDIDRYFSTENELVSDFLSRTRTMSEEVLIRELQRYLLGAIKDTTVVGKYSTFHDHATYTLGYGHPETKRLAYMFCMALDGSKTGMAVLPEVLKDDTKKYQHRPPVWKETDEEKEKYLMQGGNEVNLKRPSSLGTFIMDQLHKQAEEEGDKRLAEIEATFKVKGRCAVDLDLIFPWQDCRARGERLLKMDGNRRLQDELNKIEEHVRSVYTEHRAAVSGGGSPSKSSKYSSKKANQAFTGKPIEVRQDEFRKLSKIFASYPPSGQFVVMSDPEIARVRASYAYFHDAKSNPYNFTRFPWDVAMRELTDIKARAVGPYKALTDEFYNVMETKNPFRHRS